MGSDSICVCVRGRKVSGVGWEFSTTREFLGWRADERLSSEMKSERAKKKKKTKKETFFFFFFFFIIVGWGDLTGEVETCRADRQFPFRARKIHSRCANFERHHSDNRFVVHSVLSLSLLYSVHNVLFATYIIRRERESQIGEKRFFSLRLIFFFFFLVTFVG